MEGIAGRKIGIKTIGQKIIDLEEQKSQIEQEIMDNEATLAEAKEKVVNVANFRQSLTTFEGLFKAGTPEEQRDLLQMHISQLIYTPDEIQLALFAAGSKADKASNPLNGNFGSGGGI